MFSNKADIMSSDSPRHAKRTLSTRRNFVRAAGASSVVGLAGCTGGGSDLSGEEIHVLTQEATDKYTEYWDDVSTAFEEETGASVKIEYAGETGSGPKERILQLTQAGNPPEVVQATMPTAAELGARGLIVDHSEVISTFEDRYGPFPEQYLIEFDGNKTFIPMLNNTHSKWYRSDLYDVVPNTWEKELEFARETDEGEGGMRGEWMAHTAKIPQPGINLISRGWGNDAVLCERDGDGNVQVVMDEEPYRSRWAETLEHNRKLAEYSPLNTGATWADLMEAIENGRTSQIIMYGSRGKDNNANDFVPDIRNTTWPVPGDKYEEGGRRSWANTSGFMVLKGSNESAGKQFLEFWSQKEHYFGLFMPHPAHLVPMQEGVYTDSDFESQLQESLGPQWDYERDVKGLFEMSKSAFDLPLETSPPNPYAGPLQGSLEVGGVQNDVLVEGMSIDAAIDKRAQNMQQIIEESRLED